MGLNLKLSNRNGAFEISAAYKDDAGIVSSDVKVNTSLDYEGIESRYELIIRWEYQMDKRYS